MAAILDILDLRTYFETPRGTVKAVDGVDLTVRAGETLGVVGESGCGKTVLALSIMRLVPVPPGRILSGRILFDGADLLALSEDGIRRVRGQGIAMIFQEPMTSLNPVLRVGEQIAEAVRLHLKLNKTDAMNRAVEMLRLVGMPAPEDRIRDYPHQMSGGMRQRVMIAMALSCRPRLMLADEPTTALDVTIQAQILELINRLKEETGTSVVLITHDLGVIAEAAQEVAVMYAGQIVEQCPVSRLFSKPAHPYTIGLLESRPGWAGTGERTDRLKTIAGAVPGPDDNLTGCLYQDRCPQAIAQCREGLPELRKIAEGHVVRCWKQGS